eukprot:CAMPEP_0185567464 /NCGR_PEP_ID=MMETSP0434-20130131/736_1 /TAXON_ID=626734 ORGANISM="Favella taraikaensis, Strain Fe Narragansett Bay" /NCGR_SAMPLE_ID=MMETSP0434 /ASSEMBLY_ACC=CAM_ASM_000379 /LENGTH=286 /DNA_ID=CAMNT_0028181711 /DNA_START=68 /DNA_END=928 /DNA_ORIENTATION=+
MHSHVSVLVLEVGLSMVTDDPVGVGCGSTGSGVGRCDLSVQVVVEALEQTLAQVHVADRVDSLCEVHATRHLAVAVCPVVLDALHVPLVNNDDNFFALRVVDCSEQNFVFLVNHDLLDLGEEDVSRLNVPVHLIGIEALLRERSWAHHRELLPVRESLVDPAGLEVLKAAHKVLNRIEASLVHEALLRVSVELRAQELQISTHFLGRLAREFHLEAGAHPGLSSEAEVVSEEEVVDAETEEGEHFTVAVVIIEGLLIGGVKLGSVLVHLLLRVHILHDAGAVPPFR